jgi:hypothetical protein
LVSYPSGLEGGLINEPVFKWLWLRKGCPNLSLGFPARESEVRRRKIFGFWCVFCIPEPPPLSRSFAEVVMDRGYDDRGYDGRKRRYDGDSSGRR